ncbi:hypothetical protein [Methyloligella solikamskensis]|uniref:Uncharacterized protein n=1 Tax=Methyloligella solikamskensis TaxID=1177756 RepID=A0ABW3J9F4_9HYPH
MNFILKAALAALALLLLPVFAGEVAVAKEQPMTPAMQKCLNGLNSCRSPCFGRRVPGPCLTICKAEYRQCKRQAQ